MYRRHISQLRPGQVLARSLYTERGDVLLGAGAVLNPFYISRLEHRGVISVFLRDGLGDDVEPNDIVSEELRAATVTHLARAFDVISTMAQGCVRTPPGARRRSMSWCNSSARSRWTYRGRASTASMRSTGTSSR